MLLLCHWEQNLEFDYCNKIKIKTTERIKKKKSAICGSVYSSIKKKKKTKIICSEFYY